MLKLNFLFLFFFICDHCPQHFTSPVWNGAEMIKKKKKKTSHQCSRSKDRQHRAPPVLVCCCYLVNVSVCVSHGWAAAGDEGWGEGFIIRSCGIKVGAAIKSRASAPGSNMPQSQQSSTGSQEDPGQATSREEIDAHEPASSAGKHRFPSEM